MSICRKQFLNLSEVIRARKNKPVLRKMRNKLEKRLREMFREYIKKGMSNDESKKHGKKIVREAHRKKRE